VQGAELARRFRPRPRFDNAAVVPGSAEDLPVSALSGDTAACLVSGWGASSAGAFAMARLASYSSGLPESDAVGVLLTSTVAEALVTSAVAEALLASPVVPLKGEAVLI
jgi:hypothetical protein